MNPELQLHPNASAAVVARSAQAPLCDSACTGLGWVAVAAAAVLATVSALANGGPFVLKYPGGDPAAKGVLARLDSNLKPARESRLEVTRENLWIRFEAERPSLLRTKPGDEPLPLVAVAAEYLIANPTPETVEVDFGFPILRGVYVSLWSMSLAPDVQVRVDGTQPPVQPTLISNSAIYGLLRRHAAETITRQVATEAQLDRLFRSVASAPDRADADHRAALARHLTEHRGWPASDATLLVEYAALQGQHALPLPAATQSSGHAATPGVRRAGLFWGFDHDATLIEAKNATGWAVSAIGEQKATQWLTRLAARFDPTSAASYESIFQSWGGDVRERAADLETGRVRPREISRTASPRPEGFAGELLAHADPTVYARVDYFTDDPDLTDAQRVSWRSVLEHLPVVFTFAPMNLLHYRVAFPPGATRTVTVSYRQYAYLDTRSPRSFQLAYVVHPASLWDSFGPIHVTVTAPEGVRPVGSVPLHPAEPGPALTSNPIGQAPPGWGSFGATLTETRGELFVAVEAEAWNHALAAMGPEGPAGRKVTASP
ncbi:MAG: hypothetical protein FJ387_26065 [Verrucomicrobia bacterium]|nr:hypothetical protein [Verrucomicrobiota bacterium]